MAKMINKIRVWNTEKLTIHITDVGGKRFAVVSATRNTRLIESISAVTKGDTLILTSPGTTLKSFINHEPTGLVLKQDPVYSVEERVFDFATQSRYTYRAEADALLKDFKSCVGILLTRSAFRLRGILGEVQGC